MQVPLSKPSARPRECRDVRFSNEGQALTISCPSCVEWKVLPFTAGASPGCFGHFPEDCASSEGQIQSLPSPKSPES